MYIRCDNFRGPAMNQTWCTYHRVSFLWQSSSAVRRVLEILLQLVWSSRHCHTRKLAIWALLHKCPLIGSRHSSWTAWPLKMKPIGCLETSVNNYAHALRTHARRGEGVRKQTTWPSMKAVQSYETLVNITNRHYVITQKIGIFVITAFKLHYLDYKNYRCWDFRCLQPYEQCIFLDVTPCRFLEVYRRFIGSCCLSIYPDDKGSRKVRKMGSRVSDYTATRFHFHLLDIVALCLVTFNRGSFRCFMS
jgi:hypothetical protein